MSYCRWSSDDHQCDVYVYEDVAGGWTTHVAGRRWVLAEPLPEPIEVSTDFTAKQWDQWWARGRRVSAILDRSTTEPLALPHDGETFNDPNPVACADRL
ncbi:hypothetical protein, partial [Isoptericola hypogeus]|uniref:hypothetical protein n=1 Tax=Isoptericola hypogeus TaxID=300179 RepID=UPI0031CF7A8F